MTVSGVKDIGMGCFKAPQPFSMKIIFGKGGIKGDWLMDIHDSASTINSAYANAPDAVAAFEGPNVDDAQVGSTITTFMELLQ